MICDKCGTDPVEVLQTENELECQKAMVTELTEQLAAKDEELAAKHKECRWYSDRNQEHIATITDLRSLLREAMEELRAISLLGGNLPDDRLTNRTGPNDAAARGLIYVEARRMAAALLAKIEGVLK
jgi:hypothetical protein